MSSVEETMPVVEPVPAHEVFSIGAVTAMTGISEATLRVWERRYRFPQAARSSGGHRQYTREDVLRLQWVKQQMDDGMRAGRAIRARLTTTRRAAVAATLQMPLPSASNPDPALASVQAALLTALLAYDEASATRTLVDASAQNSLDRIVLDVIGPTLLAIGNGWEHGEIEVVTEHFASNFLRHQLYSRLRASPPPFAVSPIVLSCAPDELHEGGLLMLAALLRYRRWPVIYLGQSLPLADLPALVTRVQPSLIVFAAMSEASALALANWPTWLKAKSEAPPELQPVDQPQDPETAPLPIVGYGGRAFCENPDLAARVPGVLLGATLDEGCQRIHRLMLDLNVLQP